MKNLIITIIKIVLFLLVIGFLILIISPFINKNNKKEVNKVNETTYKLTKEDITGEKEIVGSTIIVKDETGNTVKEWTATEEQTSFYLKEGKYALEETVKEADGNTLVEVTEFGVSNTGIVDASETVVNKIESNNEDVNNEDVNNDVDVPITDSSANIVFYVIGLLGLALGIYKNKRA